jgi:hypothetical protein
MTDEQSVDTNTTELKRITRDYKIAAIAVSSFNRSGGKGCFGYYPQYDCCGET